jgi:hypothetical protein
MNSITMLPMNSIVIDSHTEATVEAGEALIIEIAMHSHTRTLAPGDIDGYVVLAFCWILFHLDSSSILGTGAFARTRVSNSQKYTHKYTSLSPSPSYPPPTSFP